MLTKNNILLLALMINPSSYSTQTVKNKYPKQYPFSKKQSRNACNPSPKSRPSVPDYVAHNQKSLFTYIYEKNIWAGGEETYSGSGSTLSRTKNIRKELPKLFKKLNIKSLIDAPCGDLNWIKELLPLLDHYIGIDIVEPLIAANRKTVPYHNFVCADLRFVTMPKVDAILCKDLFLHIPYEDIFSVIRRCKESASTYLITNSYEDIDRNQDVDMYQKPFPFRFLNLELPPFSFPKPLYKIRQIEAGKPYGKHLMCWRLVDLL